MLSAIGSSNSIQMVNALNAFKAAQQAPKAEIMPEVSEGINLTDNNSLLKNQNIEEIRQCAMAVGENNISEDDIKYGLTYGRSVIAEFLA